jgi:thioesterase domain-containing protein
MTLETLTAYLHEHIPLTRALAVAAAAWDGRTLRLTAPLAPNLNHRGTAFGGSLSALAILSGWGALYLALGARASGVRLVIQRSALSFDAPADGDFAASSTLPAPREWERFQRTLERRGRARVTVPGELDCLGRRAGRHEGVYVAVGISLAQGRVAVTSA